MFLSAKILIFLLSFTIYFIHSVFSIECYRCESDNTENCGENFYSDGILLDDCGKIPPPRYMAHILSPHNNATGCVKVEAERNGKTVIMRSCYFGDPHNTKVGCSYNPADIDLVYRNCHVCTSNACNGASSLENPFSYKFYGFLLSAISGIVTMRIFSK